MHNDSEAEIQSQTVEQPMKIRFSRRGLKCFEQKFCAER